MHNNPLCGLYINTHTHVMPCMVMFNKFGIVLLSILQSQLISIHGMWNYTQRNGYTSIVQK